MATYYVATTGNDASAGTSGFPWKTIQHAFSAIATGDTILIRSGTYGLATLRKNADVGPDSGAAIIMQPTASYATGYATGTSEFVLQLIGLTGGTIEGIEVRNARNQWGAGVYLNGCHGTGSKGSHSLQLVDMVADHNHSYGILTRNSSGFDLIRPEVYKNDTGIEIGDSSDDWYIEAPLVHDNDQLVAPGRGGNGMVFYRCNDGLVDGLDASGYTGGLSYNNRCVSSLYGKDGGHFEQYEAWDIEITNMRGWNSANVIETGQESPTGYRSDGWYIHHNIFYATDPAYPSPLVSGANYGMVLRAMDDGIVSYNTFHGLGAETLLVMTTGDFRGDVSGLSLVDNIIYGGGSGTRCVSIPVGASVTLDYNDLFNPGGSLGKRTGDQTHGINLDPLFVDLTNRDFNLTTSSPCRGAGQ